MADDPTLLRRYATERTEAAFAELVRRHLPLVYSAAVRRLNGDTHRAEDVAQVVFCTVAREAHRLADYTALTGWLYTATRNAVIDEIRSEKRRRAREEEAHRMQTASAVAETPTDWTRLRPLIDAAMDELDAADREAVLLRFFQGRPFAEIGAALGVSEDTARKRVDRALDKLGGLLQRHKIVSTSAALAALLASETLAVTPAGLFASVTSAALAAGGTATAAVGVAALLTLTKAQAGLAAVVVAGAAAGLIAQQHALSTTQEQALAARQRLAEVQSENTRLAAANTAATAERTELLASVAGLKSAAATRSAVIAAAPAAKPSGAAAEASPSSTTPRNHISPERLAYYHQRFDAFVQQRGLTPEQADRLFKILSDWDDTSSDFQASVRSQGLVWTQELQNLRNRLQQQLENDPLTALLGDDGRRAYFEFEGNSFYRAMAQPVAQRLVREHLPLTDEQTNQLVRLVKAHLLLIRPDPASMSDKASVDWPSVVAATAGFVSPEQLAVMQSFAARQTPTK